MTNIKYIVDVENNQISEIEMTEAELKAEAKRQKIEKEANALIEAEAKAKATAKAEILDRLGLTADELQTILG
jgi:predicted Fe-Mo cluster-binding NifX family protein